MPCCEIWLSGAKFNSAFCELFTGIPLNPVVIKLFGMQKMLNAKKNIKNIMQLDCLIYIDVILLKDMDLFIRWCDAIRYLSNLQISVLTMQRLVSQ